MKYSNRPFYYWYFNILILLILIWYFNIIRLKFYTEHIHFTFHDSISILNVFLIHLHVIILIVVVTIILSILTLIRVTGKE